MVSLPESDCATYIIPMMELDVSTEYSLRSGEIFAGLPRKFSTLIPMNNISPSFPSFVSKAAINVLFVDIIGFH